jgi:hypothetical protein
MYILRSYGGCGKMRSSFLLTAFLTSTTALANNIVLVNDDGWAEINIRTLYDALTAAGESVLLSAPALNQSGRGIFLLVLSCLVLS